METIPPALTSALDKERERHFLLNLEGNLIGYIDEVASCTTRSNKYVIDAKLLRNSYMRLLAHQACTYYNLKHWNTAVFSIVVSCVDSVDYSQLLQLIKNGSKVRLSDYCDKENEKSTRIEPLSSPENIRTAKTPKILKLKKMILINTEQAEAIKSQRVSGGIEDDRAIKEALYIKKRQEIFQADAENDNGMSSDDEDHQGKPIRCNQNSPPRIEPMACQMPAVPLNQRLPIGYMPQQMLPNIPHQFAGAIPYPTGYHPVYYGNYTGQGIINTQAQNIPQFTNLDEQNANFTANDN